MTESGALPDRTILHVSPAISSSRVSAIFEEPNISKGVRTAGRTMEMRRVFLSRKSIRSSAPRSSRNAVHRRFSDTRRLHQ